MDACMRNLIQVFHCSLNNVFDFFPFMFCGKQKESCRLAIRFHVTNCGELDCSRPTCLTKICILWTDYCKWDQSSLRGCGGLENSGLLF